MALNTPILELKLIQPTDYFADEAFNAVIQDADNKLVGVAHLESPVHWTEWEANTTYAVYDVVRYPALKSHQYAQCIATGNTGTTAPVNNVTGSVITDGTVTWVVKSFSEKGNYSGTIQVWTSDTYYERGDAVRYGNALYRCGLQHTSSNQFSLDSAYWQEISATIRQWLGSIYYYVNDIVVHNNYIYKCIRAHTSEPKFSGVEEPNWVLIGNIGGISEWEENRDYLVNEAVLKDDRLYRCKTRHISTDFYSELSNWDCIYANIPLWIPNRHYMVGTVVEYNSKLYRCNQEHDSTADFMTDYVTYWNLYHETVEPWEEAVYYEENRIVLYLDCLYRCSIAHTSTTVFEPKKWVLVYANIEPWQDNAVYKEGFIIIKDNILYKCVTTHTSSSNFASDSAYWIPLTSSGIAEWKPNTTYYVGQVVMYDDMLYRCYVDHISGTAFPPDLALNYWKQVGSHGINEWQANTSYTKDDFVTYNDVLYRCNTTHTSGATFGADVKNAVIYTIGDSSTEWSHVIGNTFKNCIVKNRGVSGDKSSDVLARITTDVINNAPDYCIIEVGFNDVWALSQPISTAVMATKTNIINTFTLLKNAGITPIYSSYLPYDEAQLQAIYNLSPSSYAPNFVAYATKFFKTLHDDLKEYCDKNGILFIDTYSVFIKSGAFDTNMIQADMIHPNIKGYDEMGDYIVGHIEKILSYWDLIYANIQEWESGVFYKINSVMLYEHKLYQCLIAHTSSSKLYTDLSNGYWKQIGGKSVTNWVTGKEYEVNDLVNYSNDLYMCLAKHVSGQFPLDLENLDWKLINGGNASGGATPSDLTQATEWVNNKVYAKSSLVTYNDSLYMCLVAHTSTNNFNSDFNKGYWKKIDSDQTIINSANGYSQVQKNNVVAPLTVNIDINSTTTYCLPPIEVLRQVDGTQNQTIVEQTYDTNEASNLFYDNKYVEVSTATYELVNHNIGISSPTLITDGTNTGYISVSDEIDLKYTEKIIVG